MWLLTIHAFWAAGPAMNTWAGTRKPCTFRHSGMCQRGRIGPSSDARPAMRRRRLVGAQRPVEDRRGSALEGVVVVQPPQRVAQLAPGAVEDRGPLRGQRILGAAVGVVAQHRLAERGPQLGHRR